VTEVESVVGWSRAYFAFAERQRRYLEAQRMAAWETYRRWRTARPRELAPYPSRWRSEEGRSGQDDGSEAELDLDYDGRPESRLDCDPPRRPEPPTRPTAEPRSAAREAAERARREEEAAREAERNRQLAQSRYADLLVARDDLERSASVLAEALAEGRTREEEIRGAAEGHHPLSGAGMELADQLKRTVTDLDAARRDMTELERSLEKVRSAKAGLEQQWGDRLHGSMNSNPFLVPEIGATATGAPPPEPPASEPSKGTGPRGAGSARERAPSDPVETGRALSRLSRVRSLARRFQGAVDVLGELAKGDEEDGSASTDVELELAEQAVDAALSETAREAINDLVRDRFGDAVWGSDVLHRWLATVREREISPEAPAVEIPTSASEVGAAIDSALDQILPESSVADERDQK
jgi:hypothetical protein